MKKQGEGKKRGFAVCLALVMVLATLSGCGKEKKEPPADSLDTQGTTSQEQNGQKDETQKDSEDTAKQETEGDDWSWPLPEKKELSIWLAWSNSYVKEPNDLKAIQKIEEKTNVHIKWVDVIAQEASEKFGLMIASGDYPDILRGAQQYYTGGLEQA